MKAFCIAPLFALFAFSICLSQSAASGQTPGNQVVASAGNSAPVQAPTPAELKIDVAKRQIKADSKKVQTYNTLALAYLKRARESADPSFQQDAQDALSQGFQIDPTDFQLQKTRVALLLARRHYTEAKESATILNCRTPDDVMIYGYLAEANIALGDYPDAESSAQWMLNMLPYNVPALLIAAQLRSLYGETDGALQSLNLAYSETAPAEVEELAWIANQIALVEIDSGKSAIALPVLEHAEKLFPHYIYTRENLARARMAQHQPQDAVTLLLEASKIDMNPDILYDLAKAEEAAGQSAEAASTFARFEKLAAQQADRAEDASRDLVLMYAANPASASKALDLAKRELASRHDVWTQDAYAWALYSSGRFAESYAAIQKAIAVGIQSAQIFNHAGHIAQKLDLPSDAAKYFELSVETDPASEYALDSQHATGLLANAIQAGIMAPGASNFPARGVAAIINPAQPTASVATAEVGAAAAAAAPISAYLPAYSPVPSALLTPHPTDTARLIHNAQAKVASNPKEASAYAQLGAAYFQRARETGDVNDYQLAEEALNKSLDLESSDFAANAPLQTLALVCMGEHRFDDALTYSQRALSLGSGDLSSFAVVGDADADKGEYDKAQQAYTRLEAPGSVSSPEAAYVRDSRISYLKFIHGDTDAAIRLMMAAIAEAREAELKGENLAWLYYELGEFSTQAGDVAAADTAYLAALSIHPGDYRALAGLARLRGNQGKYSEAITLYQRAIAVVPMPIFVGELGDLYTKTGNLAEASKQYQLVEYIGLLGHINQVLHNRDLALFYADHDIKLDEALELAHKEFEVRHDIYTWDALAWALYKNGKYQEADQASHEALRFGTRDSLLLYHAGMIAERLGHPDQAKNELKEALTINPHFHVIYAETAQQRLNLLESQASTGSALEQYAH